MHAEDLVAAIILAVIFASLFDLAPIIAKALVRQAARWWKSDVDTAEERAAEWQALVEDRPVGILKIGTGLHFWVRGALYKSGSIVEQWAKQAPQLLRRFSRVGNILIWLSGASPEILQNVPEERVKYAGLGGSVFMTASTAGVSMAFAITTALKMPLAMAISPALAFGLFTLSLDRWMIVSSTRRDNRWKSFAPTILGLVSALVLSIVISMPFVLQIFQPEIDQQIAVMHAQRSSTYLTEIRNDPLAKEITQDRAIVAELDNIINSNTQVGTRAAAMSGLSDAKKVLKRDLNEQASLTAAFERANNSDNGLVLRMQALSEMSSHNSSLNDACWLIFLLVTAIECLPLITKLLLNLGPPGAYETILAMNVHAQLQKVAAEKNLHAQFQQFQVTGGRTVEP